MWSGFQPLGPGTNIMDLEDFIVSNNILPLGSVVYLLFCTHKNGWGWKHFIQEANSGNGLKFPTKVCDLDADRTGLSWIYRIYFQQPEKTEKIIKNWYRQVLFHTADTSTFLSFYLFSKRRSARIHIACTMIAA